MGIQDRLFGVVKLAGALVALVGAALKLDVVSRHKLLFICLVLYILADLGYYSIAATPARSTRILKWVIGPVVGVVGFLFYRDFKLNPPQALNDPPIMWVVAFFAIATYLAFDVIWSFAKRHYDKWEVAGAAAFIGGFYAWMVL